MRKARWLTALVFAAAAMSAAIATAPASAAGLGVVILHGGGAAPNQFYRVMLQLKAAGYIVDAPLMCWSNERFYDTTVQNCAKDVDAAFERVKAAGATQFVLAGHSAGGIFTEYYASFHPELVGVVLFAPSRQTRRANTNAEVLSLQALVNQGKGDQPLVFDRGFNQYETTPNNYLSYIGPTSPLSDSELLPKFTAPTLWVAGTLDSGQRDAEARYGLIPMTPLNQFVWIEANHARTPDIGVGAMISWLDGLSAALGNKPAL